MSATLRVVERIAPDLALVVRRGVRELWSLGFLRRATRCTGCDQKLPGKSQAWRPLTNSPHRGERYCPTCIAAL